MGVVGRHLGAGAGPGSVGALLLAGCSSTWGTSVSPTHKALRGKHVTCASLRHYKHSLAAQMRRRAEGASRAARVPSAISALFSQDVQIQMLPKADHRAPSIRNWWPIVVLRQK